jgi:hypothetical protein
MDAVDAALPYGFPCGSWWWHAWKAGDPLPPGWRPPVPGADNPKPRLPAEASPGDACQSDEIDMEVAKAVDAWRPDGMANPLIGIHETRRLACGAAWARLEAWDGGLCQATVRDGLIEWTRVPGAGALVPLEGRWTRGPAEEAWDEEAQDWKPATADADVRDEPEVDPFDGTRPVRLASPEYIEELFSRQASVIASRDALWGPMDALVEAGLATMRQTGQRGTTTGRCYVDLAPSASEALTLFYNSRAGYPRDVSLRLAPGADPDSEIVRKVEAILGVTALPAGNPRPPTGGAG